MQEKSFTSLWLGSIMVLMQRTLDWGNSLKISLSSLCIEVKRVRKKKQTQESAGWCVWAISFSFLGSQHNECQRLCRGKTKPGLVHDVPVQKPLIYRLTATFERCEIRWFTCSLLRPVRTCLSFWGKRSNSVIQQTVRSWIWRNWRRRKLHLSKTACENRSSESPCLSASNCLRHRAKKSNERDG